jgi:hypothetical protein
VVEVVASGQPVIGVLIAAITLAPPVLAAPPPGHPGAAEAMERLRVQPANGIEEVGKVLQAIPSNAFVYVEVEQAGGKRLWLAAPLAEHRIGGLVGWGGGRLMNNFYSRRHQRSFESVLFVDKVTALSDEY